jgi:hypothetical protein
LFKKFEEDISVRCGCGLNDGLPSSVELRGEATVAEVTLVAESPGKIPVDVFRQVAARGRAFACFAIRRLSSRFGNSVFGLIEAAWPAAGLSSSDLLSATLGKVAMPRAATEIGATIGGVNSPLGLFWASFSPAKIRDSRRYLLSRYSMRV